MNCRKCGAELREEQKVCIVCGTRTVAGGGFYVEQEKAWRPSRNVLIGAGVFVLILIILMIANLLRVTPPGDVAMEWFDAMSQRQFSRARECMTPALQEKPSSAGMELMAIADGFYEAVNRNQGKASLGSVTQDSRSDPKSVTVTINLRYPAGSSDIVVLKLVKSGRAWRINELLSTSV